jgi:DNA-binding MarR family transcriptional regulator
MAEDPQGAAPGPRRLDTGELDRAVGLWLRLAQGQEQRRFNRAFEGSGVSPILFAILLTVEANPGCRQADLGAVLRIRQPNLVEPLDQLISRGLVARQPDPRDRRAQTLTLTAEGASVLGRLKARHDRLLASYRERLGGAAYDQLVALLRRFVEEAGAEA